MADLFNDIRSITASEWKKQIERDLKGITAEQLKKIDRSSIELSPFFTAENRTQSSGPAFTHTNWLAGARIDDEKNELQNGAALDALNCGANSVTFLVDDKTSINNLLQGVQADIIQTNFEFRSRNDDFCNALKTYCDNNIKNAENINGYVQLDPVSLLVKGYHEQADKRFDAWTSLFQHQLFELTELSPLVADASIYHNAGCTTVTELALAIAHLNEQLHLLTERNIDHSKKTIHLKISVSASFFESTSKIRALRILCVHLLKQYQLANSIFIHAYSSVIDKTAADTHNNLIRASMEGMAAIAGGANAINLIPYDYFLNQSDSKALRLAIAQMIIFKEEAFLADVADVGAGSFFIENYTAELIEKAWKEFQQIEEKGGLISLSKSGELKKWVTAEATQLRDEYVSGKKTLIGVNKYPNANEKISRKAIVVSPSDKGLVPVFAEEWINESKN
jgi:methylmalonyl-CoA mutase